MSLIRAEVIARAREFIREGISASAWIKEMSAKGLSYRRTDMLADYREVFELEKKEGLARFIRKGYAPAEQTALLKEWALSQEYMYKVKTQSRLRPGEPITERFVNIMSDKPLTIEAIESQVVESWQQWEKYAAEELTGLQVWSAVHRVME
jgi:hypothetical protein